MHEDKRTALATLHVVFKSAFHGRSSTERRQRDNATHTIHPPSGPGWGLGSDRLRRAPPPFNNTVDTLRVATSATGADD